MLTELKNELNDLFNGFSYVYSVTARVKEINSLIQKIILRRDKYYANTVIGEKYKNLTKDTYKRVITDLVGVRVAVRNTEEFRTFDNDLKQIFPLRATDYEYGKIYPHEEKPFIAEYPVFKHPKYETDKVDEYKDIFHLEPQKSGYRSVHYTLSKNEVYIELQLRTIIDDGYSEINHEFVYKNENHPYYKVLNRLSDVLRMLSSASIYNELLCRECSVDVGVVEIVESHDGKRTKKQCEIDFVVNRGTKKYYIQSSLNVSEPSKLETELRPLKNTKDFFKRIIISKTAMKPWTDEEGILHLGLYEFLLNENSLDL